MRVRISVIAAPAKDGYFIMENTRTDHLAPAVIISPRFVANDTVACANSEDVMVANLESPGDFGKFPVCVKITPD